MNGESMRGAMGTIKEDTKLRLGNFGIGKLGKRFEIEVSLFLQPF
jgi:hypothetical protein